MSALRPSPSQRLCSPRAQVFAETLVSRGDVIRCSFRALKMPLHSSSNPHQGRLAVWQWPAVLTAAQSSACLAIVRETVAALDLQSGVFGLQLVLDPTAGGCAFLEINLRPHLWPMLHDVAVQSLFADVWLYSEMAVRIALNESTATLLSRATPAHQKPRLQMTAT